MILAFDTTSSTTSVALFDETAGKILGKNIIYQSGKQSELLIPEIEKILHQNQVWYKDLNALAVTNGPGSFTGSRIGLTVARTISAALSTPIILVNSCEVIEQKYYQEDRKRFVILDAKADEFFYSFSGEEPKLARLDGLPKIFPAEEFFLCGSGKKIAAEILEKTKHSFKTNEEDDVIDAEMVALVAWKKIQQNGQQNIGTTTDLNPLYLRSPKITERKK